MKTPKKPLEVRITDKVVNALGKEFPLLNDVVEDLTGQVVSARKKAADEAEKLFMASLGKAAILASLAKVVTPRRRSAPDSQVKP